ncbi:hypothetical protein HQN88_33330 [Paenibacillus qinlingensis]|nr:hypothetical protein [Paenibacillus qinlingensis]
MGKSVIFLCVVRIIRGYICPVCGFDKLEMPPYDEKGNESFEICHCCGFEFGVGDVSESITFVSYRNEWISEGFKWFFQPSRHEILDLTEQLKNIQKINPQMSLIINEKKNN